MTFDQLVEKVVGFLRLTRQQEEKTIVAIEDCHTQAGFRQKDL